MFPVDMIISTQTVAGILGNFSLLCGYIVLHFIGSRIRSTDLILKHLIVANSLVLLCKGVPQTMAVSGWKQIHSDFGCKLLFFLHRVGTGVSIGSICLLSVFQVITISPHNSRWAALKITAPKCVVLSLFLCWILQIDKNITKKIDFGYCSAVHHDGTREALCAVLLLFPDVLYLGLMLWAGSSMVLILYRHKQQVQHIQGTDPFPRSFPESRASKTIFLLGSTFVYFYTLFSIFQLVVALFDHLRCSLVNKTVIIAACFPTVSPFLLTNLHLNSLHLPCLHWQIESPSCFQSLVFQLSLFDS
uniref:Vomeronasal type-1 receptor n=1 Tax=Moschus moschiferus TaxID=68415 RepID=A0A8C6DCB7_MOSMO